MTTPLELNGTELLLLQQQMEGDVAGLGYTLEVVGVDRADFTGTPEEDIHRTNIVQEADESGEIRKVKFYIDYPGTPTDPERAIMLSIFNDGHLTCSKPVTPDLLDATVNEIALVKSFAGFLIPLNRLMDEYLEDKFRGRSTRRKRAHARETSVAFRELVEQSFDATQVSGAQHRLYQSLVASIGVKLCEGGVPSTSGYPDIDSSLSIPDTSGKIKEFFEDYSRHVFSESSIDYSSLASHLRHILIQDWDRPLEIVEFAIDTYDLS